MNREQNLKGHKNVICCIFSVVILIVLLFPLYWTLVTSLKTEQEIFQIPPTLWPNVLNTKSYTAQLDHGDFNMFRSFGNSLLISLGATVISVVLAVPASYGIAKYKFRFRKGVLLTFLVTNMHLYNTWLSAILADATIGIPFSVLILKNYFASIPNEMEEAAYIDGCGKFGSFFCVLIPIAKPGIIVCAIFSFLYAWGDLAYSMTFILEQEARPITAGIYNFMGQYGTKWSYLTAYAIVTIIPVALIFIFMQKYIISGMTSGAVKG